MDQNGNGRITLEEWEKAFEQATKGKKFLTQDDLADLLYPAAPTNRGKSVASDGPSRVTLLKGLFSGEIGSSSEGPRLGMRRLRSRWIRTIRLDGSRWLIIEERSPSS